MTSPAIAPLKRPKPVQLFLRRILALFLRHIYLYMGSWPRLIEMMYWPLINILMFGFVSLYILRQFSNATIVSSTFLVGVLLSEVLIRNSQSTMVMFMEEIWSRNLGHLFASPLTFFNYNIGLITFSTARTILAITPTIFIAQYLFNFSLFGIGTPLAFYVPLLILNGWWFGLLIVALVLRFGLGAEWLAWMSIWILIPLVAPYYPVSVLPHAMQLVSYALPATYVFESVKSLLNNGELHGDYLLIALGLNVLYFIAAIFILRLSYNNARQRGGLLQVGE